MGLRLTCAGLWDIMTPSRPPQPNLTRIKNEVTVLAHIHQNCEPSILCLIMDIRNPKDALRVLKANFERSTDENQNRLWGEFNIQMELAESMQEYVTRMKTIVCKLKDSGKAVPDGRAVDRLIHALAKPCVNFSCSVHLQHGLRFDNCEDMMLQPQSLRSEESPIVSNTATKDTTNSTPASCKHGDRCG